MNNFGLGAGGVMPTDMNQLQTMLAGSYFGATPAPIPGVQSAAQVASLTVDQVKAIVSEQLHALGAQPMTPDLTKLQNVVAQLDDVFKRALSVEEYGALQAYVNAGGAGFIAMLNTDTLYPIVQLLWETIKENTK